MADFNWTCPYCSRDQVVTEKSQWSQFNYVAVKTPKVGLVSFGGVVVVCSNVDCQEMTLAAQLIPAVWDGANGRYKLNGDPIWTKRLLPQSGSKVLPEYIPQALRDDYREACLVRDLSPKASATLARRCLQGMLRDFGQVSGKTLFAEIQALREAVEAGTAPRDVSADSIDAIDAVRRIGNIGAHMEKDVNEIIDVEPDEAQTLIALLESLFEGWYIERHKRQAIFSGVVALGAAKDAEKKGAVPPAAPATSGP